MISTAGALPAGPQSAPAPRGPELLPPLREDLVLLPGPSAPDGAPTWSLHDPARHRFMRIGWMEFEILSRWGLGTRERVAAAVAAETTLRATPNDVVAVLGFAARAGLLLPLGEAGAARLLAEASGHRLSATRWLLKNYLFLRLRLVNPDRFLDGLLPLVGWVMTPGFALVLGGLALLGFYMIGRQWEAFAHSFLHLFSFEGAIQVGIALSVAKIVHELGHGLAAKRFGCRVPGMGVALLVLWPVLWTDTTDAWRLVDRRQRLAIDAAGMTAEILLAVIAALLWCVLPDGPTRTGAFLLCSSTWLLTVAVNLNPMMRFDGYFLLSDLLDIPNLQDRTFALVRWWLRRSLFGLADPPPERFPLGRQRFLIAYGLATLIYRFGLFLGIALLVYHLTFKALGVFLMALELWWFIARPIVNELVAWKKLAPRLGWNRHTTATASLLLLGLIALAVPWRSHVAAPALLRAERQMTLYTAEPGELRHVTAEGTAVAAGDELFVLGTPKLSYDWLSTSALMRGLRAKLTGQSFDADEASSIAAARQQLDSATAKLRVIEAQAAKLAVRASFAGVLIDVPPVLQPGLSMRRREPLGTLIDPTRQIVEAYVEEGDLARVRPGADAAFFPETGDAPVKLVVAEIDAVAARELETPDLASIHGGGVAVRKDLQSRLVPEIAVYRIVLTPAAPLADFTRRLRGTVVIAGDRVSLLERLYRQSAALLIRETGF